MKICFNTLILFTLWLSYSVYAASPNETTQKVYRNETLGFMFSYPASFNLREFWKDSDSIERHLSEIYLQRGKEPALRFSVNRRDEPPTCMPQHVTGDPTNLNSEKDGPLSEVEQVNFGELSVCRVADVALFADGKAGLQVNYWIYQDGLFLTFSSLRKGAQDEFRNPSILGKDLPEVSTILASFKWLNR